MNEKQKAWFSGFAVIDKGGPGSGSWGHAGRPGMRGGSSPKSGYGAGMSLTTGPTADLRAQELREVRNKIPEARRGLWTGEVVEIPTSSNRQPTAYEVANDGKLAAWKRPMSTRAEDGVGPVMRGRNGKVYAYKRDRTFEVKPTEASKSGKVPVYGKPGKVPKKPVPAKPKYTEKEQQEAEEEFIQRGQYLDMPGSGRRFKVWMGKNTAKLTEVSAAQSSIGKPSTVLSVRSAGRQITFPGKVSLNKVEHRRLVGEAVKDIVSQHEQNWNQWWLK